MQLSRAILFAKDIDRLAIYYTTLGLRPLEATRTANWIEFAGGLALHAIPPEIASEIEISSPPVAREETPIKLVFAVDDLEAECARLDTAGIALTRRPWGVAEGVDPEGNIFQVCPAAAA